ncbi:MAG: rhodanese-related sulfurtransferase [Betaproteobacteria bacterium]|nr:rhodanese-related sulfurtransferase [Betaproteobacteria bacterium]
MVEPHEVHQAWKNRDEIALLDVREEDPYAQGHPLFAANLPMSRIEVDALRRLPRQSVRIVVFDAGEGLAEQAAFKLQGLGYGHIELLRGGLTGWAASGLELFRDVNVPSKAFGEWVEDQRHTPSMSAQEVKALLDRKADVVVLDVRRFDEYQTMNIPGSVSVPGGELVLRARALAPNPSTRIVVNCAGRTRSIIGTQSLVNAGIPNPVCALRNGTIGWTLAQQALEHGANRRFPDELPPDVVERARQSAFALTVRLGVGRIQREDLQAFLVCDTDQVRAPMTASWLAQMGWEVHLLQGLTPEDLSDTSASPNPQPPLPEGVTPVEPAVLKAWLADRSNLTQVIDVGPSAAYVKRHIPGAWWVLRSQLATDFARVHKANRYVVTCTDGLLSPHVVPQLRALVRAGVDVHYLQGGNAAWWAQGLSGQQGESYVVSQRTDRYRRPYEGTQVSPQAMQAYLDWEFGLVAQLRRDGSHHFKVV